MAGMTPNKELNSSIKPSRPRPKAEADSIGYLTTPLKVFGRKAYFRGQSTLWDAHLDGATTFSLPFWI